MYATLTTQVSNTVVRVHNQSGILTPTAAITLRNKVSEINSITNLPDVAEVEVVEGATLVYNATTVSYDVRRIDSADLDGIVVDGGTF
tara:strand:+ start:2553 stop:2816 length:264 start_codon:yes stop_codon:yes gene_type:complete